MQRQEVISKLFSKPLRQLLLGFCCSAIWFMPSAWAQQDRDQWWFEIELIVFKRDIDPASVAEQFHQGLYKPDVRGTFDLIHNILAPDITLISEGLEDCDEGPLPPLTLPDLPFMPLYHPALADMSVSLDTLAEDQSWRPKTIYDQYIDDDYVDTTSEDMYQSAAEQSSSSLPSGNEDLSSLFPTDITDSDPEADLIAQQQRFDEFVQSLDVYAFIDVPAPQTRLCSFNDERLVLSNPVETAPLPVADNVPSVISGVEWPYQYEPYLLDASSLQLNDLAKDIQRQRNLTKLLHMGWRQKVLFGQTKAATMRLYAGQNFAADFDSDGLLLPPPSTDDLFSDLEQLTTDDEPEDLFDRIQTALESDEPLSSEVDLMTSSLQTRTDQLWELDGRFKVFLRYIKGTPYLHIESDLDYRAPVFSPQMTEAINQSVGTDPQDGTVLQPDLLKSFPFSQIRRVISTQMHYFDHPLFGMVVQIRRHRKPQPPEVELAELEQ